MEASDPGSSYQLPERFTIPTTESIIGTSTSTPTTAASAAPELMPNREMAAATASSKKFDAPISAAGAATPRIGPGPSRKRLVCLWMTCSLVLPAAEV